MRRPRLLAFGILVLSGALCGGALYAQPQEPGSLSELWHFDTGG